MGSSVRPRRLAAAGALVFAVVALPGTGARAAAPAISPLPGTPDASPETQISILGVSPRAIRSVTVRGARSGMHGGSLRHYSGERGASFVLAEPLNQGETVRATVRIAGQRPRSFGFTVARLAPIPPVLNLPKQQPDKLQHFTSRPDLLPPQFTVRQAGAASDGDVFLTPLPSPIVHPELHNSLTLTPVGPGGPMIVDAAGRLVWFRQLTAPDVAANLRLQRYGGRPVLTWWQGPVTVAAFGLGEGVIADSRYRTLRTVRAGNGYRADLHEFALAPGGAAFLTVYSPILVHLAGTPAGMLSPLLDSLVQEIDPPTGLVLWEWHAYGHIPLATSYATPKNSAAYDAFHLNSLQPLPGGRLLVSARDTSAVYLVDQPTGRVRWALGGRRSSFRLGRGARFYFQHDAELHGDRVTLFDDEGGPPYKAPVSRGLSLRLDLRHHTARVLRSFRRSAVGPPAESEGSFQTLANGNVLLGFGSDRHTSEFSASGRLLFDAALPVDDGSYRAFRSPWSAAPVTRPDVALRATAGGGASVYVSWNGATAVARWEVLGGAPLTPLATVPRHGFETRIDLPSLPGSVTARALDAHGHVLAASSAVRAT